MSTTFGPPIILTGPLPAPLPFGLFSVATIVDDPDLRWGNGAQIGSFAGNSLARAWDPCGTEPKAPDLVSGPEHFAAFTVVAGSQCPSRGNGDSQEDALRREFQAIEQWAVEREISHGEIMLSNPFLSDGNVSIVGAAESPRNALALLENYVGGYGKQGVIHADRGTVSAWSFEGGLRVVGDRLYTFNGTPVVSGGGYGGSVPDGGDAPDSWVNGYAFATGPVEIHRGEIEMVPGSLAEALTRETNQVVYFAERDYLVIWDRGLQVAVLVDRSS